MSKKSKARNHELIRSMEGLSVLKHTNNGKPALKLVKPASESPWMPTPRVKKPWWKRIFGM